MSGAADGNRGLLAFPRSRADFRNHGVPDGRFGDPPDVLCAAAQHASPLNGMVWMYMLMSAFHSAPWLKLISGRRTGAHRS